MALKDWKKNPYNNFGDGWVKKIPLDPKECNHSERNGNYCEHCEMGIRNIDIYVLDDQSIGSPNYGLWYVSITRTPKKWFKTKNQALAYAKDYMNKH